MRNKKLAHICFECLVLRSHRLFAVDRICSKPQTNNKNYPQHQIFLPFTFQVFHLTMTANLSELSSQMMAIYLTNHIGLSDLLLISRTSRLWLINFSVESTKVKAMQEPNWTIEFSSITFYLPIIRPFFFHEIPQIVTQFRKPPNQSFCIVYLPESICANVYICDWE